MGLDFDAGALRRGRGHVGRVRSHRGAFRAPLVPAAALRNRNLVAANLTAFFTFSVFFSLIFLGSLLMQRVLGYSATKTGVSWLATSATAFVASAVAGARLVGAVGVRRLLVTGLVLLAGAGVWLTQVPADANYVVDSAPGVPARGRGRRAVRPSIQIGGLSGVADSASGFAAGLVETMREIGGAAGRRPRCPACSSHAPASTDSTPASS